MLRNYGITRFIVVQMLAASALLTIASYSNAADPTVRPAVDAILGAFDTYPLVAIGEKHDLANELGFYGKLVRDPRFASKVGNVVVEFGASQHQDILDRYLSGSDVAYAELSKVWRNTVAWTPTLVGTGYQTFFAQVRAVNLSLPPDQQIRVLLSEPPIDWGSIRTHEEWQKIYDIRDTHAASVIEREILNRGKKALVIYGEGHFHSYPWPSTMPPPPGGRHILGDILKQAHRDSLYVVGVYSGYNKLSCSNALEAEMKWPREALISPIKGTPLEKALMPPECREPVRGINPPLPADENSRLERRFYEISSGASSDGLLYLAPATDLMWTSADAAMWMDLEYSKELARRGEIRGFAMEPWKALVERYSGAIPRWRQ